MPEAGSRQAFEMDRSDPVSDGTPLVGSRARCCCCRCPWSRSSRTVAGVSSPRRFDSPPSRLNFVEDPELGQVLPGREPPARPLVDASHENEFFDAISVASESSLEIAREPHTAYPSTPFLHSVAREASASIAEDAGEFEPGTPAAQAPAAQGEHVTDELLRKLLETETQCKNMANGIEVMVENERHKYTIKVTPGSSDILTCLETFMPGVTKESVIYNVTDASQRLKWDGNSFTVYEKLGEPRKDDPYNEEILYLIMSCPRILGNRDMLQKCWQRRLPGGGWVMIFSSFDDDTLRPITRDNVRARSLLSGYLVRDACRNNVRGIQMTNINSLDFGGNLPGWIQNTVRKMLKNRPLQWAGNLEKFCREHPVPPNSEIAERILAICGEAGNTSTCSGQASRSEESSEPSQSEGNPSGDDCSLRTLGEATVDPPTEPQSPNEPREVIPHVTDAILIELLEIDRKCRGGGSGSGEVECLSMGNKERFWALTKPDKPDVITCLTSRLSGVRKEDVLQAVTNPAERTQWDDTVTNFEKLQSARSNDPYHEEVISFVLPCPPMIANREMLQKTWQRPLPDGEGTAVVFQSFDDETLRPSAPNLVRARAHIAGYLLRDLPESDELELVAINSVDFGGNAPVWMRNRLTKMLKNKPIEWARCLEKYCQEAVRTRTPPPASPVQAGRASDGQMFGSCASFQEGPPRGEACGEDGSAVLEVRSSSSANTFAPLQRDAEDHREGLELQAKHSLATSEATTAATAAAAAANTTLTPPTPALSSTAPPSPSPSPSPTPHHSDELLDELLSILRRCRGEEVGGSPVECLSSGEKESFYATVVPGTKEAITCLESRISGVTKDDLIQAVTDPIHRKRWDDTIDEYDLLQAADPSDPLKEEVIYFTLPAKPLTTREVLQRCWQRHLPDGRWVMMFQSFESPSLRPITDSRVRASARLAGYVLTPTETGFDLVVVNSIDFGGNIPSWLANKVQKMLRNKPIEWVRSLERYCQQSRRTR